MYKKAFKRLPERFRKQTNENLYYVLYNGFDELEQALTSIRESRNIDNAKGKTLDLIGENVGQFRTDEDDELFRLLIKVRIIANLSIGDITTLNEVLSILVKEVFLGLQEVWQYKQYLNEPAAIQVKLGPLAKGIPYEIIDKIKAAGVRVLYEINYPHTIYVGAGAVSGEVITITPPPLDDIEIKAKHYIGISIYAEHEIITIGKGVIK